MLAGGHLVAHPSGGQFYAPTVLAGVTPAMRIWREEVFGPVLAVVRVSNDDEAVALANDCAFGLSSAVFSRSARRANAIAERLEVELAMPKTWQAWLTGCLTETYPFEFLSACRNSA